jgi:hypothetical protein
VIADAIARLDDAELRRRYSPAEMMRLEIYPEVWEDPDEVDLLLEDMTRLRAALQRVTGQRFGLLVMIN